MGTIILLAGFLLTASANPIANSGANSIEDAADAHSDDMSSTDDHSQSSNQDDTNNDTGEHEHPNDDLTHSDEDNGANGTGEQDISRHNSADNIEDNTTSNTGDEQSSSVSHDSTKSTEVSSDDKENNHADNAATSANSPDSTGFTQPSTEGSTTTPTELTTTSSDTTVSTTTTKTETSTQASSDTVPIPTPADADPRDCKNATERNHTYELCTYSCQGDEMFTAPDNSSCYLHPGNMMVESEIAEKNGRTEHNNETGVCYKGDCFRSWAEATATTTESSTADTTTQQSNDTVTVPADADPKDCKNATEKNHTYVLCTYSCQGDEMFTAPDNSPCYLYPAGVAPGILITKQYNRAEHNANETGVCFQGNCIPRLTASPEAPTVSSPSTTTTTTTETGGETQSPMNGQESGVTSKPNVASQPFSEPSPPQDAPAENDGSPEKPLTNMGSSEGEKASSPVENSEESIPGPSPSQKTPTENVERPENQSSSVSSVDVEDASSAVPNGPVALPGALAAMT